MEYSSVMEEVTSAAEGNRFGKDSTDANVPGNFKKKEVFWVKMTLQQLNNDIIVYSRCR